MRRRDLMASAAAAATALSAAKASYRVGITSNTRGGWEDDVFLSFRESRAVGYRWVESFIHYFTAYWDKPAELQKRISDIGVKFVTICNGGPLEMHFEDPARHAKLIEDHLKLGRFIRHFGCTHLKINLGPRRPEGTTEADLVQISALLQKLGAALRAEGIRLAVHAHMWAQFENQREVDYVMSHTNAKDLAFVLDTGHITMAGMDPVALTKKLGHRIVEFHLKDTKPEWKGGAPKRLDRPDMMKDPPFFPLGHGGVDFAAIKSHLDAIGWQGFLTVELDSSPFRPPRESARISLRYFEDKLGIR
ncbi:MAG: TIM barrel protein [Acidobacteria bacterium]|nr:TIM barrel protein [Acidobacteriota bacterium]